MSDKFPYLLIYRGQTAGWVVVEKTFTADIHPFTGEPTKNAGQPKYKDMAYPHKFEFAPMSLLRLAVPEGATVETLEDWKRVHQEAVDTILEAIKEWKANG